MTKPQPIFSRTHKRIIVGTVVFCLAAVVILYLAGFIPSPISGKQDQECQGAQENLVSLQHGPGKEEIAPDKIEDAKQLADRECAKAE